MSPVAELEKTTHTETRLAIDLVVPAGDVWLWHLELARRLRTAGHDVQLIEGRLSQRPSPLARAILALTNPLPKIGGALTAAATAPLAARARETADLCIALGADARRRESVPTLSIAFDGDPSPFAALRMLATGALPTVEVAIDGRLVGRAAPMVNRLSLVGRAFDDVLARTLTLVEGTVANVAARRPLARLAPVPHVPPSQGLLTAYVTSTLPRLAGELLRVLTYRDAHWRVGYRLSADARLPVDGNLGSGWRELVDDGTHFYADPFPFMHEGRRYLFVEDYDHAAGKACISAAEIRADGSATAPRPVLVEPHHLSYPQVFEHDGAIWMIPEGSAARELVLYRAAQFPDLWVRHTVLVEGRELCDATLLEHQGGLYLFATDRDGYGSTSDIMVVYCADRLEGPWTPHPQNPITIDRAAARPGGAFIRQGRDIFLPLQDGTDCYGGGLGLARLVHLDRQRVELTAPWPMRTGSDWPYPRIHTYNTAGGLDVIDGIAPVARWLRGTKR